MQGAARSRTESRREHNRIARFDLQFQQNSINSNMMPISYKKHTQGPRHNQMELFKRYYRGINILLDNNDIQHTKIPT